MISDLDILRSAKLLIRRHGGSAGYYAASRADDLSDAGDSEGAKVWKRILKEVERLLEMEPESGTKH